ncbi:MAG: DJ-1/PfpI family protein [Tannerella sp.]|jgi:4-methyl-5(b-hydroxyethyl)-thiazole monophosphate biosynthesis|nr:DJ-1/PfpI family protein [Tannerella sp.]
MKALVLLATGFEETEAIGTIDVLRRGMIKTLIASVTGSPTVIGAHNIYVRAEDLLEDVDLSFYDAIVLPGGGPGSLMLKEHPVVREAVTDFYNSGRLIAAICAAPRVFGDLGLLKGKKATCYPGIEPELKGAILTDAPAVTDGNIITGKGPGFVFDFALAILTYLHKGDGITRQVAEDLLIA